MKTTRTNSSGNAPLTESPERMKCFQPLKTGVAPELAARARPAPAKASVPPRLGARFRTVCLGLLAATVLLAGNSLFAASPSELLQQGLYAEEVDGNINAAIQSYAKVIADPAAPRNQVAQALYRQGMCYVKLKDDAAARAALEKLVAEHSDQTELLEKARPVLEDLTNFDPAALMPVGTLAYVEFGSPGRQIETLLTMLKGTPFENPLAAFGGQPAASGGGKSPGDIVGALLNPSMVTEFKKIRGLAVGITGVAENNPPMVAVLYPGRSDALRGLILAGIGMVGRPAESIEGMQTVNIENVASVAYDDKVVIVAQPASQLQWCVKQYRGITTEPTLASGNKSFARLDKSQRQKHALTLWGDVDGIYSRVIAMFPNGTLPDEVLAANAFCDFANIDEFVLTHTLEADGLANGAEIEFKEGHHSFAYDLVRTPPISKAGLSAVPMEAVAVASFSLSQGGLVRSELARSQVRSVTGLDVGREIFANIEQVTLFVLPEKGAAIRQRKPEEILGRLGLTLTSRNPEQTRALLENLLGTANSVLGGRGQVKSGQYRVGGNGDQSIYCYLAQVNGTTVLSLNSEVLNAAVTAARDNKSVCIGGSLNSAINQLAPDASKLLLANVGGALRLMGPMGNLSALSEEELKQYHSNFEELARAVDSAVIELRSNEAKNHVALNSSLTGIPPLNQLVEPISELSRLDNEAFAKAEAKRLRSQKAIPVLGASAAPVVDGAVDAAWKAARAHKLENSFLGSAESPADLSAEYRVLWDASNLYVLVEVTDDKLAHAPPGAAWYESDGVEIYLDAQNLKSSSYGETDFLYGFNWDQSAPQLTETAHNQTNGVKYAFASTGSGYRLEAKFPWTTLGGKPAAGSKIGIEVGVNDNDGAEKRDCKLLWNDSTDQAWKNPQMFGNAELAGLIGWWKFDEKEGMAAADSSGGKHHGALVGNPKWSSGKIGGGLDLAGGNSFVRIADKSAFDLAGEVTLAAWVNIRSVPMPWMAIVTKGDTSWRLSTAEQERQMHFSVTGWSQAVLNGGTKLNAGEWHHVAAVYDGAVLRLYTDGRLEGTVPWDQGIGRNDFEVLIGANAEQANRCFDGMIDDVRIYNHALGEDRINALAAAQKEIGD